MRALKQAILDLFNLPAATNIPAALTITRVGPYTNNTGVTLSAGDVVALDPAANSSVVLGDVSASLKQFVVALATITNASTGVFGQAGQVTVTVQGVVTRGNYLRKSATTKALEDTGVALSATVAAPVGALGVALTAAAGPGAGTVVAHLFGVTLSTTPTAIAAARVQGLVGITTTTTAVWNCAQVVLRHLTDGTTIVRTNPGDLTNTVTTAGPAANGRDQAGAFTASSWVHFYYIWDGTTLATLSSATAPPTGPTMPTGYTHWAYVGAVRFGAGSTLAIVYFRGAWVIYQQHLIMVSAGTPAVGVETAASLAAAIPPNAQVFTVDLYFQVIGSLTSGFFFRFRVVTGVDSMELRGIVGANGQAAAVSATTLLPNVSQQVLYLWTIDVGVGSGAEVTFFVQGYTVMNGDS